MIKEIKLLVWEWHFNKLEKLLFISGLEYKVEKKKSVYSISIDVVLKNKKEVYKINRIKCIMKELYNDSLTKNDTFH